jgi:predicted aconitase with swiveling domain
VLAVTRLNLGHSLHELMNAKPAFVAVAFALLSLLVCGRAPWAIALATVLPIVVVGAVLADLPSRQRRAGLRARTCRR